ncbi:MAG: hypothetical protein PHO25_03400 [Syntrophomonadaceae bacterium]|nr:hypothetical protein [Syntrophomonadaceae bacterium]
MKKVLTFLIAAVIIVATTAVLVPVGLSYLSNLEQRGISIRGAPAEEIWQVQGNFNENVWKDSFDSSIKITNLRDRDFWIYFEYTGDLKQIFKHSDPVLVEAGKTQEIMLYPLDDKDSLRVLNPLDIIEFDKCKWKWKIFSGTIVIKTLNCYAAHETGKITISGKTLWDVFFSQKYGIDPCQYYTYEVVEKENIPEQTRKRGENEEDNVQIVLENSNNLVEEIEGFQARTFIKPVIQVIDKIAPGLWEEREYLRKKATAVSHQMNRLKKHMNTMIEKTARLQEKIANQQDLIMNLHARINSLENETIRLNNHVNSLQDNVAPKGGSSPGPSPAAEPEDKNVPTGSGVQTGAATDNAAVSPSEQTEDNTVGQNSSHENPTGDVLDSTADQDAGDNSQDTTSSSQNSTTGEASSDNSSDQSNSSNNNNDGHTNSTKSSSEDS